MWAYRSMRMWWGRGLDGLIFLLFFSAHFRLGFGTWCVGSSICFCLCFWDGVFYLWGVFSAFFFDFLVDECMDGGRKQGC